MKEHFFLSTLCIYLSSAMCNIDIALVKQYGYNKYYCITNSSSALSWINEDLKENKHASSIYFPESESNLKINLPSNDWSMENSLSGNVNEIIFDKRWEDFPLLVTSSDQNKFKSGIRKVPLKIDNKHQDQFVLPFSVKIKKEAHILLCDKAAKMCYWFILEGKKFILKKCSDLLDPLKTDNKCIVLIDIICADRYLDDSKWSHFTLWKNKNRFRLSKFRNETDQIVIMDCSDEAAFQVSKIWIHSNSERNGFWKIHDIAYHYTTKILKLSQVGVISNNSRNNQTCVAMFVTMCETCSITLTLSPRDRYSEIRNKTYKSWTEIKVCGEKSNNNNIVVYISTHNSNKKGFWAIGNIRPCQKNEVRVISVTSKKNLKCELIKFRQKMISSNEVMETVDNICPQNTISRFCIPCYWIFDDSSKSCSRSKICENYDDQNVCYCSEGYKSNTLDCSSSCFKGKYGHGCKKQCTHCYNFSCDNVNGYCNSFCTDNYTGYSCDIAPSSSQLWTKSSSITADKSINTATKGKNVNIDIKTTATIYEKKQTLGNGQIENSTLAYDRTTTANTTKNFTEKPERFKFNTVPLETKFATAKIQTITQVEINKEITVLNYTFSSVTESLEISKPEDIMTSRETSTFHKQDNIQNSTPAYNSKVIAKTTKNFTEKPEISKFNTVPLETKFTTAKIQTTTQVEKNREIAMLNYTFSNVTESLETSKSKNIMTSRETITSHKQDNIQNSTPAYNSNITTNTTRNFTERPEIVKFSTVEVTTGVTKKTFTENTTEKRNQVENEIIKTDTSLKKNYANRYYIVLVLGLCTAVSIIIVITVVYLTRKKFSLQRRNRSENTNEIKADEIPLAAILNTKSSFKSIKLKELEQYVKESIKNGEFERQYYMVPQTSTMACSYGTLIENKKKNNYINLVPYDHTRVILQKVDGNEFSDYINANYIDGYNVKKAYIATQFPKKSTVNDFWRMIWQENVHHIFMLSESSEDKKKMTKYWPEKTTLSLGDIIIEHIGGKVFTGYEQRTFRISSFNQSRDVNQFDFFGWSANVTLYPQSLVPFMKQMYQISLSSKSPVVVQCNTGVGKTGVILLCDVCLRMADKRKCVSFLKTMKNLRDQRPKMVTSVEQYKLAHLAILEYLFSQKTTIPCSAFERGNVGSKEVKLQMEYLKEAEWRDDLMENLKHSRVPNTNLEVQDGIKLPRRPPTDDIYTYINAVTVDGFRISEKFIVTHYPVPNTLGYFWRLVSEKEISAMIFLNELDPKEPNPCVFYPTKKNPTLIPADDLTISHKNSLSSPSYDTETVHLTQQGTEGHKAIEIILMKNWLAGKTHPEETKDFLTCLKKTRILSKKSRHIVVACYDGITASGLFTTADFVFEKIKSEQVCDICEAVRTVRRNRSQFVRKEDQFSFLFRAVGDYISTCKNWP